MRRHKAQNPMLGEMSVGHSHLNSLRPLGER